MSRCEEDLEAIGSTALSIRDTVERHTGQLFKIRGEINALGEMVTDTRGEILEVKLVQSQQSRTLDEHSSVLAEHSKALTELRGGMAELRGGMAEILRRLPAND
ncbi:hypothetical protein EV186_108350 [Labedaea rhizosphaerae]|uniref:Uncharacterized protein n=2 Tax=Labedaea rhizosphaerae TaxID=598644 RepID=A0A4R6RZS1_LABRH|nr:hypothetical protein EV186_108350 [Labedaea rhizosphaerae]